MLSIFRVAARSLFKTPGFTATAVLTLALCLAANVAIFAVVDAVVIRALPFPQAERLATLYNSYPNAGVPRSSTSLTNYYDRRTALKSFSSMAIIRFGAVTVSDQGNPITVPVAFVSPEFFRTLGVRLALGREFTEEDMNLPASFVAILTHEYWRDHFGSDPQILGRKFVNDGVDITVVGVLPPGFRYLTPRAYFRPAGHNRSDESPQYRHGNSFDTVARLAPGVSLAQAQSELDAFNAAQLRDDPHRDIVAKAGYRTTVRGLREDYVQEVRPMLLVLQGGVAVLLLIGAVNLANLFLLRAANRTKELAVRKALGAQRRHLILEVLAETLLVGVGGGGLGILLGAWGVRLLKLLGTDSLPLGADIRFDSRAAAAALAAAVAASVLLAIPASWFGIRGGVAAGLRAESRGGTAGTAVQRLRLLFTVIQVSLAFVLLSGAGLLAVSLKHVLERSPGFRPDQLYGANLTLPRLTYPTVQLRQGYVRRLLAAVSALPGVSQAAVTSGLPFDGFRNDNPVAVLDDPTHSPLHSHFLSAVSAGYWSALQIPLVRGRLFTADECLQRRRVVVVDQAFARRYWPGGDPIGKRIGQDVTADAAQAFTIVGVVGSVKQTNLTDGGDHGAVYFPYPNDVLSGGYFSLAIKSDAPASSLMPLVRQAMHGIDPEIALANFRPMDDRIAATLVSRRTPAILAGVFAAVALLLAAVGTFGVLSYAVSQRRHEIGVRMALGALPGQIRSQFLSMGVRIIGLGALAGAAGAWIAGRSMQAILFHVPALQPLALGGTLLVIGAVTLCACLYPAWVASRVDPMVALRDE